jgi:major vault protein
LILRASESCVDEQNIKRLPGDRWIIQGPTDYVPQIEVKVLQKRKAIPLDKNEGIYIRDMKSGKVRAVISVRFMLNQDEELWEKELPVEVEKLLKKDA